MFVIPFQKSPKLGHHWVGIRLLNLRGFINLRWIGMSCFHILYRICKSIESHHMQNLCQIILQSYLIHLLGTVSTDYFWQSLTIAEHSQYFILNWSTISINISPQYFPVRCRYFYRLVFTYTWVTHQSHPGTECFSPTEMSPVRHDQGGIGRKWRHGCGTKSVIYMKTLW